MLRGAIVGEVDLVQPHAAQDMLRQLLSLNQDKTTAKFQSFSQGLAFIQEQGKKQYLNGQAKIKNPMLDMWPR